MEEETKEKRFCKAVTQSGKPCRCPVVGSTGLCTVHDPNRDKTRYRKASVEGGKRSQQIQREKKKLRNQLTKAMVDMELKDFKYETKEDLDRILQETMYRVNMKLIDPKIASATTNAIAVATRLLELEKQRKDGKLPAMRFLIWAEKVEVKGDIPGPVAIRDTKRLLGPGNGKEVETIKDEGVAQEEAGQTLQIQKPDPNPTPSAVGGGIKDGGGG